MATYRKPLKDIDGNFIIPAMTGDQTEWVQTGDIADGAVTAGKIDFSTFVQNNFSPSADTTAAWISGLGGDGVYWIYYNVLNKFATQPSQWGFLEVIIWANNITQIWHEHTAANILVRAGNTNGWNNQGWHTP